MSILLGVVLIFAALSGAVAVAQAVMISRVPAGEWRGWLLGWWRFGEIEQRAGSAAASQFGIYRRAVIACVIFVVFGLVLSGWATSQRSETMASLNTQNGWQYQTASANHPFFRAVAPMPGATSLES